MDVLRKKEKKRRESEDDFSRTRRSLAGGGRFCGSWKDERSRPCSSLYFRSEDRPRGALDVAFYPSTTLLFSADCVTSRTDNNDRGKKERDMRKEKKKKKKVAKWHECVYPFRLINKIIRTRPPSDFAIEVAACRAIGENRRSIWRRRRGGKERD